MSSHATQIEAMLATPDNKHSQHSTTPFRPRGKRGYQSNIVKPVDVTNLDTRRTDDLNLTSKRKVEDDSILCFPDEDNNSVLQVNKLGINFF